MFLSYHYLLRSLSCQLLGYFIHKLITANFISMITSKVDSMYSVPLR